MQRGTTWFNRNWWTLQRFGLSPTKLPYRVFNRSDPRVFVDSVPKSGTHLIERALCLHPRLFRVLVPTLHVTNLRERGGLAKVVGGLPPGGMLVAHLDYDPALSKILSDGKVAMLVMVRDPRDVAISEAHYAMKDEHWMHEHFRTVEDPQERIRLIITGTGTLAPLAERVPHHLRWRDAGALVVRFEDLVGPEGGGDLDTQLTTLREIYEHIGIDADDNLVRRVRDHIFSDRSPTFRRGAIGQWRTTFDEATAELFTREAGELLPLLGYSAD